MAEAIAAWKAATQTYLDTWGQAFEQTMAMPGAQEATDEGQKTLIGTRATLNEMTRRVFEPMVELSGGVPLGEFRRMADAIHTVLLRLDAIDDRLTGLEAAAGGAPKAEGKKRKKG